MEALLRKWFAQLMTGKDNQTLAIGRVMGAIIFAMVVATNCVIIWSLWRSVDQTQDPKIWGMYLDKAGNYLLLVLGAVAALIAGTAFSEPPPASFQSIESRKVTVNKEEN
jgi:hypothetical protein